MGRGQVALFVLAGLILLLFIGLIIYAVRQKAIETDQTAEAEDLALQNDPELAAEKARMQGRMDDCLKSIVTETVEFGSQGVPATSIEDLQSRFASELAALVPDCLNQFNTQTLAATSEPRATVAIRDADILATVDYSVTGELDGKAYRLSKFTATLKTDFGQAWKESVRIQNDIEEKLRTADSSFIKPDGSVDLYAYADEGIYLDLYISGDTCVPIISDYSRVLETGEAFTITGKPFTCPFTEPAESEKPIFLAPVEYTCSVSAGCSPIPFTIDPWPEDAVIHSKLPINPFSFAPDAAEYPLGDYVAVAEATNAEGRTVFQVATVQVNA